MKKIQEKGTKKRDNPAYTRLIREKNRLVAQGATKTKAFKAIMKQIRATPSKMVNDPTFCRIKYLRYADDVRHLTQYEILLAEKGGSEDVDLRVISSTWSRKTKGKGAYERSRKCVKALKRCPARPA